MEFRRRRELKRTKIEIIPMIDTIFFLLVFFMLSSLALVKLKSLPVNLPKAATALKQRPDELTITVDKSSRIFVNKIPTPLAQVGEALVLDAGQGADLSTSTVIINADRQAPYGIVVNCMDAARQSGLSNFAIETKGEE